MNYILIMLLLSFLLLDVTPAALHGRKFERSLEFPKDQYREGCTDFQWTVHQETKKVTISWKSTIGATYTAIGISENGGMKGADIITVRASGDSFIVDDRHSEEFSLPMKDRMQNVELVEASFQEDGRIHAIIRRDIQSCDEDDIDLQAYRQYVMCASGALDQNGEISFHGPNYSTGVTNFLLNENDLFASMPLLTDDSQPPTTLTDGVTVRGDLIAGQSAITVDFELSGQKIFGNETKSTYISKVFQLQHEQAFEWIGLEQIWEGSSEIPFWIHHITFSKCKKDSFSDSQLKGELFEMPDMISECDALLSVSKGNRRAQFPDGYHVVLEPGTYIIQVHYETPSRLIDYPETHLGTPGVRFWMNPPVHSKFQSKRSSIKFHYANWESIKIPADPLQKEVTLQYQISADMTEKLLPQEGVQAVGGFVHMHEQGSGSRVELIRDGVHIMDILNHKSYDFNMQTYTWKPYTFLPGDSLIISCIYKPLPDQDVVGGPRGSDEMCLFVTYLLEEAPEYRSPKGQAVREGEAFLPSYANAGSSGLKTNFTKDETFPPKPSSRDDFVPLKNYRLDLCGMQFRTKAGWTTSIQFSTENTYSLFALLAAFVLCVVLSSCDRKLKGFSLGEDLRSKRNSIVYIGELLFSTIALPIVCIALSTTLGLQINGGSFDATNLEQYSFGTARGLMHMQCLFYLVELFYRLEVRLSLVLHHTLTAAAAIILTFYSFDAFLEAFNYAMTLILLSLTEQPLYLVLLLKNMGLPKRWPGLWRNVINIAAFAFLVTRVVVVYLLVKLIIFNLHPTNQSVQETSLSGWWVSEYNFDKNTVTILMIVIVVGILGSNASVFFALHHMKGKGEQQSRGKDVTNEESANDTDEESADDKPGTARTAHKSCTFAEIDLENHTSIIENTPKRAEDSRQALEFQSGQQRFI